ncbi:MAG TPA: hypothetical protein PK511_08170 [Chitinophagales bacterium]|nr:hypothetical protein [Chitinophagales bacterium]HMU68702.1 hypothetical protein [Chitinophagales bacterium]HMX04852.1 hypothetical protein [Chitinophagales bacterium]HMZ89068.1 hypothetical protein [Chitinophagales bacterium]HNA57312.1 hypothetical protein [Chitinophagales bacterium]
MQPKYFPSSQIRLILIVCGFAALLAGRATGSMNTLNAVLIIIQLVTLELILRESTIFNTIYYRLLYICSSVIIIGAMMIILHWPYANYVVIMGMSSVAIVYTLRSINKQHKALLDYAKWIWLVLNTIAGILNLLHGQYALMSSYLATGAFFLMMLVFFISPRTSKGMEQRPPEEDDLPIDQI